LVHAAAKAAWDKSKLPDWLDKKFYVGNIQPLLKTVSLSILKSAIGVSLSYAVDVRSGKRIPHPRHWQTLALLVESTQGSG
jgi:hypothetical protein